MNLIFAAILLLLQTSPPRKMEVETSIRSADFPATSLALLQPLLADATDIRYFRETDGEERTYEVKFVKDGFRWSVEFSREGEYKDTEIERAFETLPSDVRSAFAGMLQDRFTRHNIRKVQEQYRTWPPDLGRPDGYEITVAGTSASELGVFEFNLDADGSVTLVRRVVELPSF